MSQVRFGIDLGGTTAKLAVVDVNNRLLWKTSVGSAGDPSPAALVKKIATESAASLKKYRIKRIGVGVAGDIDFHRGFVRVSPNLGWTKVPLKKLIEKALRTPTIVDNDANVAAWGIYKTQVSKTIKNVIVVTLGTGVGGGIIFDGEVYRGATGSAGEIGHTTIDEKGDLCNCGNLGCLETYAGGFHIARRVKEALKAGQLSSLQPLYVDNPENITPLTIAQAAQKGDPYAKSVWDRVGHVLGRALGDMIYVYNPDVIYLTGGVAQAGELVLKPARARLAQRAFQTPIQACKIKIAKEAPHIGVIGAALL